MANINQHLKNKLYVLLQKKLPSPPSILVTFNRSSLTKVKAKRVLGIIIDMDVIKFRDNTMVCGCITTKTLIYGVVKLNLGIRLEYCIDCVCDLLQVLNLWV